MLGVFTYPPEFIPERLTMARHLRGLYQTELSKLTGLSCRQLSKFEKGILTPDENQLSVIADALSLPVNFFYRALPLSYQHFIR